jgi:aspartate racemase
MTRTDTPPGWLGVVGGLGPLVSAEFLKTIYEEGIAGAEQNSPRVLMYSDPTFPDRTSAFLAGDEEPIVRQLTGVLESLREQGAARIVICCVTMHHVLHRVPAHLRALVVSLIDVAAEAVIRSDEKHLLLCSTGTRRLRLFEAHPRWTEIRERVVLPSDEDQDAVHRMIYALKVNEPIGAVAPALESLLHKYGVQSFVAGCTEMHLFAKHRLRQTGQRCIDPLYIIARDLESVVGAQPAVEGAA